MKIFWALLFFRARASGSKTLNYKKNFNTVKDFRATLFFRASVSCLKILNGKKYILNTLIQGTLFFRASASCSKIQNDKKYFNTVENFRPTRVFQGKTNLLKYLECKSIAYSIGPIVKNSWANSIFQDKSKMFKNPD